MSDAHAETALERPGAPPPGTRTIARATDGAAQELPADLLATASQRLGAISVLYLSIYLIAYLTAWFTSPLMPLRGLPVAHTGAGIAIVSSVTMLVMSRSKRFSAQELLDYALIYLVVAAFAIALAELALPWRPGDEPRGNSYVVFWILLFPMLVPATPGKILLSALTAALMGPIALMVTVAFGNPMPNATQFVLLVLPNFLAAAAVRVTARMIFQLGTAVEKARTLGNYELVELLGRGGMGEVWRARHRLLIRPAAVKLVRPEVLDPAASSDPATILRRFEREAQATALLSSPHTVELYDFGVTSDGTLFYAMELLDGMDLDALIGKTGPVPAERAVFFLLQLCDSLADAHERGMVHRDVKPANIHACRRGVQRDFIKVLDFGLVRTVRVDRDATKLTAEGSMTGTPAFMAPEQAVGEVAAGVPADVYAIGGVAYWLLTGRLVFEADTAMKMIMHHVQTPPIAPSKVVELPIPEALDALVLDCLAKRPEDRPANAAVVAERLTAIRDAFAQPWDQAAAARWWQTHSPSPPAGAILTRPRVVDRLRSG